MWTLQAIYDALARRQSRALLYCKLIRHYIKGRKSAECDSATSHNAWLVQCLVSPADTWTQHLTQYWLALFNSQRVITTAHRASPQIFSPFKQQQVIPFWKGNFKLIQHEKILEWGTLQFSRKSGPKLPFLMHLLWMVSPSIGSFLLIFLFHWKQCIFGNFGSDFLKNCKVPHSDIFSCCISLKLPFQKGITCCCLNGEKNWGEPCDHSLWFTQCAACTSHQTVGKEKKQHLWANPNRPMSTEQCPSSAHRLTLSPFVSLAT